MISHLKRQIMTQTLKIYIIYAQFRPRYIILRFYLSSSIFSETAAPKW